MAKPAVSPFRNKLPNFTLPRDRSIFQVKWESRTMRLWAPENVVLSNRWLWFITFREYMPSYAVTQQYIRSCGHGDPPKRFSRRKLKGCWVRCFGRIRACISLVLNPLYDKSLLPIQQPHRPTCQHTNTMPSGLWSNFQSTQSTFSNQRYSIFIQKNPVFPLIFWPSTHFLVDVDHNNAPGIMHFASSYLKFISYCTFCATHKIPLNLAYQSHSILAQRYISIIQFLAHFFAHNCFKR